MTINFFNENVSLPEIVKYSVLKRLLKGEVVARSQKIGDINYIFCSDDHLLSINIQFLQHDYYTDVITFDYSGNNIISGDIFISVDRVLNNSEIFGDNYTSELVRVIFHGLLHLLGYKDKTPDEAAIMRQKEAELITKYFEIVT